MADLNGDGIPDVVTGTYSQSAIIVWIGKGDGTFQAPVVTPIAHNAIVNVAVGDFNRDGMVDIVAAADDDREFVFSSEPAEDGLEHPLAWTPLFPRA